jgi:hypothetical protein
MRRRQVVGSSAGPWKSFRPRMIRDRASAVISATGPPHLAACAPLAANKRLPRSSRFELPAFRLSRIAQVPIIRRRWPPRPRREFITMALCSGPA